MRDGKPDYVPIYELYVDREIQEAILGKRDDRASSVEFYYKAGYDYVPAWPHDKLKRGSQTNRNWECPIKDWKTFEDYPWPDPNDVDYSEFESIVPILPDGMRIIAQTGGIFESVQQLIGYEQLCFLLMDDPLLVEAVFERLGEIYESMYRNMASITEVGALVISDDMGFKTQTLIGINDLRKFVLPKHKKLAQIIHGADKPCILHSCGQIAAIMNDLIHEVGIDAKHSYEDGILPVTEAKSLYGSRIAILGGFDMDRLCRSSEDQVRDHTRTLVTEMGGDGGYALGSGNSIAGYVPVQNYLVLLDEAWRLRKYI
ncbi:MAG: uroporphyrinogen decarboxylase family protein [Armatimonadota bacterium]